MNRREFINGTTLATSAALFGVRPSPVAAAEPPARDDDTALVQDREYLLGASVRGRRAPAR